MQKNLLKEETLLNKKILIWILGIILLATTVFGLLSDGLIAYYSFDNYTGTNIPDEATGLLNLTMLM